MSHIRPYCQDHEPVQHRDMKPPWCPRCGLTEHGLHPVESTASTKQTPKPEQPTEIARRLVVEEFNANLNRVDRDKTITIDDTYFYFFTYILGCWKIYVSTTVPDNKIYEVTYNAESGEAYLDVYVKLSNRAINIKENS